MKKFLVIAMCIWAVAAFARPPHGGHHGRHHHRGNDGVWLAAGITSIVANSIGILNAVTTLRYVTPAPVAVSQTVHPQVEYATPPIIYPQTIGVQEHRYYEQRIPVAQTILVPIQVNGRIVYHQEQRVIYVK